MKELGEHILRKLLKCPQEYQGNKNIFEYKNLLFKNRIYSLAPKMDLGALDEWSFLLREGE